jgi:hypothetical protein
MTQRQRKLIGTVLLVMFVFVYALVVMAVGGIMMADKSGLTRLVFFAITGLVWVLPAGALIRWMQRPVS